MTTSPHQDVVNVLLTERAWRDLARWDAMRDAFHDDARVRVSWFRGSGPEFVEASRTAHEAGSRSFHEIGAVHVDAGCDRALAHADAAVHVRGDLDGVEVDVVSHGRLFWRVRRDAGRWRIATFDMVYLKDTLAPADPTRPLPPGSVTTDGLRPGYRYLTLLLRAAGHDVDQGLPGADRPDLVAALLAEHRAWFERGTGARVTGNKLGTPITQVRRTPGSTP